MKKLYTLLLIVVSNLSFGQVFYSENMGTPGGTTTIAANTFQNTSPILYSGTADVRASTASTGYSGASAGGNVYFASNTTNSFLIEGINTSTYNTAELQLSFGHHKNTTAGNNELIVEVSTNGTTFTPLTYSRATGTGTANWTLITITSGIPSTSNLRIRFTQSSTTTQFRIDDVKLNNVSASCTLTLGTAVTACTASTSLLDNYTVTIPYTGGANATYTISTLGTVSGDNPTSVAAGNIVITFTEGTAYSITITGGTCNLNVTGASPECKVTNTLPFNEPFNYSAGTALSTSQFWTNTSVGSDEILAVASSLNYTGITSTGGAVAFTGTGSDTKAPFTTVNTDAVYASFLSSVTDITGVTGTSYFAILSDASNSFTVARVWIKNDGTQYQYGLSPTGLVGDVVWSTNLYNVGTTQYLVLRHNFASNTLSLFENPTIGGTASSTINVTPATAITNFAGFILRQESATNTPAMIIDELTISSTPNFTLSSNSFNAIEGLTMYPNPLKGNTLFLTSSANANMSVQIFDLLGKEVVKSDVINNTVNVSNLEEGIYVVKVTEEGKTATRKLVIQ
ncbi:T9SS type A sorting domain-containing protein [Flavobacterium lacisediminis]|uniref:T9SS type A sorting domain-containing protein n=1 Tax=Flavobacterium lacisediminis TaxID=2989705 RepID=A0ABT3EE20_9FLAO|nr:T9SS type A sorting domain-containing protein [Flavobacterium lacisediminis]MCW1146671.1 T9SS type A sorting domain-containing protein [Flavobacterium lacisediminis]